MAIHIAIDMSYIIISSERSEIKEKVVNRVLFVLFDDTELGPYDDILGMCPGVRIPFLAQCL